MVSRGRNRTDGRGSVMSALLPLTNGSCALINSRDLIRASQHNWRLHKGVPVATIDSKEVSLARYVMCAKGTEKVYWKNGDKCNCTKQNLTKIRPKR